MHSVSNDLQLTEPWLAALDAPDRGGGVSRSGMSLGSSWERLPHSVSFCRCGRPPLNGSAQRSKSALESNTPVRLSERAAAVRARGT